jgi:hypothetical protein
MNNINKLNRLCGLAPNELADVLENNPRAYMAVKGAVAERHLKNYFSNLQNNGLIASFREAESDFDKDFYVTLLNGTTKIVECKNVEVLKITSKASYLNYLKFLKQQRGLFKDIVFEPLENYKTKDLSSMFKTLPQGLRESGISRYEFSENQIEQKSISGKLSDEDFLNQFNTSPLSIDFQRTRNSREISSSKEDQKAARFYKLDEIDIVGACLFSRTMRWEFVFGARKSLIRHKKYTNRYSNRLIINPKLWYSNFLDLVK